MIRSNEQDEIVHTTVYNVHEKSCVLKTKWSSVYQYTWSVCNQHLDRQRSTCQSILRQCSIDTWLTSRLTLRLCSCGVIQIRISDPRSVWIMVHQRNRWIHSGHEFAGSFDAPWSRQILDHWSGSGSPQRNAASIHIQSIVSRVLTNPYALIKNHFWSMHHWPHIYYIPNFSGPLKTNQTAPLPFQFFSLWALPWIILHDHPWRFSDSFMAKFSKWKNCHE